MAEGSKRLRGLLKSQRKKFLKLFPERERTRKEKILGRAESRDILLVSTETRGKRVVKRYKIGRNPETGRLITPEEMIARFKLQRELFSRGHPVARPVRITVDKKKGEIIWEEEMVGNGMTYYDLMFQAKKGLLKDMTPEDIEREYQKTVEEIKRALGEEELWKKNLDDEEKRVDGRIVIADLNPGNAVWDPERKRFVMTDLGVYRKKKK